MSRIGPECIKWARCSSWLPIGTSTAILMSPVEAKQQPTHLIRALRANMSSPERIARGSMFKLLGAANFELTRLLRSNSFESIQTCSSLFELVRACSRPILFEVELGR